MPLKTANKYGNIYIKEEAIAMMANTFALDCYGVLAISSIRFTDSIYKLFKKPIYDKGVRIEIVDNQIDLGIYVILKDGVNIDAVKESIKSTVIYHIEKYTNMRVKNVEIFITGISIRS